MGLAKQTAEPLCRMLGMPCEIEPWTHEIASEKLSPYPDHGRGRTNGGIYVQNSHIKGNGGYDLSYSQALTSPMLEGA